MKRLAFFGYSLALAAFIAAALAYYALATTDGARRIWRTVLPEAKSAGLEGSLLGGLTVREFQLTSAGSAVSLARLELDLDLGIVPPRLIVRRFMGDALAAVLTDGNITDRVDFPDLRLPFAVEIKAAHIAPLRLSAAPFSAPLAIEELSAQGVLHSRLRLSELRLNGVAFGGRRGDFILNGALDLAPPYRHNLMLQADIAPVNGANAHAEKAALRVAADGSLRTWQARVKVETPWPADLLVAVDDADLILAHGTLAKTPWRAEFNAGSLTWPVTAGTTTTESRTAQLYTAHNLHLTAEGSGETFHLAGGWRIGQPAPLAGEWRLQAEGYGAGLELTRLEGVTPAGEIGLTGRYDFTSGQAAAEIQLIEYEPVRLTPALAPLGTLTGTLPLLWQDQTIALTDGRLAGTGSAAFALEGRYYPAARGVFDLMLRWRQWVFADDDTRHAVLSPAGELHLSGDRAAYRLNGAFDLEAGDFPAGRLAVEARGSGGTLTLDRLDGVWPAGRLRLKGAADLAFPPTASGELHLDNIDPGQLWPAWPGRLDGALVFDLKTLHDSAAIDLHLKRLDGELRGAPLAGSGRFYLRAGNLQALGITRTVLHFASRAPYRQFISAASSVPFPEK